MQHVLLRKWGDGLSAGHLPNSLASLLKANGYNHVPLYVDTWGPFDGSAPVWCVQVILYEKELSYDVRVVLSYPVFMPKPSTHRTYDPRSIVPHIQIKSVHR